MTVNLLAEAEKLGKAAHGYRFGSEGADGYYDCSGLVWKAATVLGLYKGARFTTWTITEDHATAAQFRRVATPAVGDIVVWSENAAHGHMGVVSGPDQFYSARSVASGIGFGKISTMHAYPVKPFYLRPVKVSGPPLPPVKPTHTVKAGDTLWDIAAAWDVTLTALEKANPSLGPNFNVIHVGAVVHHP